MSSTNKLINAPSAFICCPAPVTPSYDPVVHLNPHVPSDLQDVAAAAAEVRRTFMMGSCTMGAIRVVWARKRAV